MLMARVASQMAGASMTRHSRAVAGSVLRSRKGRERVAGLVSNTRRTNGGAGDCRDHQPLDPASYVLTWVRAQRHQRRHATASAHRLSAAWVAAD
jgi:hypothetical protein